MGSREKGKEILCKNEKCYTDTLNNAPDYLTTSRIFFLFFVFGNTCIILNREVDPITSPVITSGLASQPDHHLVSKAQTLACATFLQGKQWSDFLIIMKCIL